MKSLLHTGMLVLCFYLAVGVACAGERLKNDPAIKIRTALAYILTWGKHFIKGLTQK